MLVGIANIIDTQILQNGAAIRTAVVFFYLANEGLSCLENAAVIGLPVPEKLKEMLAQLKDERESGQKSTSSNQPGRGDKPLPHFYLGGTDHEYERISRKADDRLLPCA